MLTQPTLQTLRRLKLTGMADAFEQQLAQPAHAELSFEERFGLLVDRELTSRDNRRLSRTTPWAIRHWRIAGPMYAVGAPLIMEIFQADHGDDARAQQIIRLEKSLETSRAGLATYLENSGKRPGWLPVIEKTQERIAETELELARLGAEAPASQLDWMGQFRIAMQLIALLIYQLGSVLAITRLSAINRAWNERKAGVDSEKNGGVQSEWANDEAVTNPGNLTVTEATNFTNLPGNVTNPGNLTSTEATNFTNSPVRGDDHAAVEAARVADSLESGEEMRDVFERAVPGSVESAINTARTKATNLGSLSPCTATNLGNITATEATNFTNSENHSAIVSTNDGNFGNELNEGVDIGENANGDGVLKLLARDPRAVKQAKERLEAYLISNSMTLKGFAETFEYPVTELSRFRSQDKEEGRRGANSNIVKRLIQQFLMPSFEEWKKARKPSNYAPLEDSSSSNCSAI